jgi:putative inorganic carbon (hco3(-)) transporter
MTLDYPIAGTGFKAFSAMKERYTEVHVDESDNHNMYLFICSQMGIPALFVFLFVVYGMYATGATLYRESRDQTVRIIGLGGVVMAAGVLGVNMFGSRMCETHVNGNFWVYLAILSHLWQEHEDSYAELSTPPTRGA